MNTLSRLSEVLENPDKYSAKTHLFLPMDEDWNEDTYCAVLSWDDDKPQFAKEHGLDPALDMYAVQGIVSNARQQRSLLSPGMLLDAFLFYYDNDAFIDFDVLPPLKP